MQASLTGRILSIKLDKVLDPKITDVKIFFGVNFCIPSDISKVDISCTFTDISVGYYKPIFRTNLGDLILDNTIADILVNMQLDSISPNTVKFFFNFREFQMVEPL